MAFLTNNQHFANGAIEVVKTLREALPSDVFTGIKIPSKRPQKMVIVIDGGGSLLSPTTRSQRINLMMWGGTTWEETGIFANEVDFIMRGVGAQPYSRIIWAEVVTFPVPSGDGQSSETPVYSAAYDLIIVSENK